MPKVKKAKAAPCSCGVTHVPPEPRCLRYNGWTNYETWCVHLWLTNEYDKAKYWEARGVEALQTHGEDGATERLAAILKDEITADSADPTGPATMYTDLLGAALSEVDWYEVAAAFLPEGTS